MRNCGISQNKILAMSYPILTLQSTLKSYRFSPEIVIISTMLVCIGPSRMSKCLNLLELSEDTVIVCTGE